MTSPCLTCTKVRDPSKCENKLCGDWRRWFLYKWAKMRAKYASYITKEENDK